MAGEKNMTVREVITALLKTENLDAEVAICLHNSDPVPVQDVNFAEPELVVIGN